MNKSLSAKLTKWPNTLKQFVGNLPANCLSVFGHFLGLALKGIKFNKKDYVKKSFVDYNYINFLKFTIGKQLLTFLGFPISILSVIGFTYIPIPILLHTALATSYQLMELERKQKFNWCKWKLWQIWNAYQFSYSLLNNVTSVIKRPSREQTPVHVNKTLEIPLICIEKLLNQSEFDEIPRKDSSQNGINYLFFFLGIFR